MRSLTRVVLPIVIVFGLVGGLSYFMQYTPPVPVSPKTNSQTSVDLPSLIFLQQTAVWDPNDNSYAQEFEINQKGHYDFWVANPHPVPARVILRSKSCKCAYVDLGLVDPTAEAEFMQAAMGRGIVPRTQFVHGLQGFDRAAFDPLIDRATWTPINESDMSATIPAADPKSGIKLALIRLNWNSKTAEPMLLSAVLNYVGGDPKPADQPLQVPIVVVPPVQIVPGVFHLGDLKSGDVKKWTFILWSATRASFPCDVPKLPDDPCLVFEQPKLLTVEECRAATALMLAQYPNQPRTRLKSAYFLNFTVHERLGDNMLELGPLARRFVFNPGTEFEASTTLTASVLGDIRLAGAKDDDDRIALGDFRGDRPLNKTILLNSGRADLKIKLVSFSPDSIKVSLKERAALGGGWELRLEIPANAMSGPFPTGSSVILETLDAKPRRMRIPISGVAFVP